MAMLVQMQVLLGDSLSLPLIPFLFYLLCVSNSTSASLPQIRRTTECAALSDTTVESWIDPYREHVNSALKATHCIEQNQHINIIMGDIKRPLFTYLLPTSLMSRVRRVAYAAPAILFGISAAAIVSKQSFYRTNLDDESIDTWDRIERRAYVKLPDGRMALVYPVVYADVSPAKLWESLWETFSMIP